MRFCGNFYFNYNLRCCGFKGLSGFLSSQIVVLILSNCDQNTGFPTSFSGLRFRVLDLRSLLSGFFVFATTSLQHRRVL